LTAGIPAAPTARQMMFGIVIIIVQHLTHHVSVIRMMDRRRSDKCIAVRKVATPLRELTCHMGSHSVTCHPAELTFPPLPQPKLVLD